ncbi:MAG: GMC family oxidoreductase [Anaerolineaceae bacterium]|nr:GMC family oxidoreductase [Anaerolineaceae bacterium]MCY3928456.1 GMC family oxidoreductase [Acidobacteriota bacterium]
MVQIIERKTWDAIVIGSGITGGWAAKELTEKGLETLVLEAGPPVIPERDYSQHTPPWQMPYRGLRDRKHQAERQPIQSRAAACDEWSGRFFVDDIENPYSVGEGGQDFLWIRARIVGGRSLLWGRQSYRWSDLDFGANARDGYGTDWPIRYRDLAPWYDHVESFVGIAGQAENMPQLPDGQFLSPIAQTCMEEKIREDLDRAFGGTRRFTPARVAVLTKHHLGRRPCHYCGVCRRGCASRSYFSSLNATLPAAEATGRLTLRPNSVVRNLVYDADLDRVSGVHLLDAETMESIEVRGRVVFLCASTIESARILLNSATPRFSEGLANSSGQVGRNLMDHIFQVGANGNLEGLEDKTTFGRRPNSCYLPRFVNLDGDRAEATREKDFLRGFGYQCGARRGTLWQGGIGQPGFGADYKASLRGLAPWRLGFTGFGENLPNPDNRVTIDPDLEDRWGVPAARITMSYGENETAMREAIQTRAAEMLEALGAKNIRTFNRNSLPGFAIHEMGTARMGRDPATSVLNGWCQSWDVPNLFVTDGAAMASSACQNPSLTYMALTARACDYAVRQMQRLEL